MRDWDTWHVVVHGSSPGSEVRMWYNPDEMENRQRAVFAIGCEILDEELVTAGINVATV